MWFDSFFEKKNNEENLRKDLFLYIGWLIAFLWNRSTLNKQTSEQALKMHYILEIQKQLSHQKLDKIHDLILSDRRIKVREIAEAMGISIEQVHFILHNELNMKKLSTRWMSLPLLCKPKANWYANISWLFGGT